MCLRALGMSKQPDMGYRKAPLFFSLEGVKAPKRDFSREAFVCGRGKNVGRRQEQPRLRICHPPVFLPPVGLP